MAKDSKNLRVTMPAYLKAQLDELAAKKGVSQAYVVNRAVERYLKEEVVLLKPT